VKEIYQYQGADAFAADGQPLGYPLHGAHNQSLDNIHVKQGD
jgi:hypothetical protein